MKVPDIFVPERKLENKIKQFLEQQTPKNQALKESNPAYIEFGARDQYLYFFDEGLASLKARGYERYPYSWEIFKLIIDYLENTLKDPVTGYWSNIHKQVEESLDCGEWFNMAFERKKDKLICYLDPEGIRWDNNTGGYVTDFVLNYRDKKEFNVDSLPFGQWVDLKSFDNNFVEYFYTRKFEDLPERIKHEAQVFLPLDGALWPIGRGRKKTMSISCNSNRAARGIFMIKERAGEYHVF